MDRRILRSFSILFALIVVIGTSTGCRKMRAEIFGGDEIVMSCQEAPAGAASKAAGPSAAMKEPEWVWREEDVSLSRCVRRDLRDFETTLVKEAWPKGHTLTITTRAGLPLAIATHEWAGFARRGDLMFFAAYEPHASGCEIVAYDLANGKVLWQKPLKGLGPAEHSKYRNRVVVAIESETIVVRSIESYGGYVECLALDDGRMLQHRLVDIPVKDR